MIFNSDTYGSSNGAISKYPVGLEGALMHVYENECNYNALMKAAGISELRYYQETGRDLFVHEAGAFSGFIEKAKAFFKKVIEKIKAMFHKFAATLNQYTMKDKEFVKKYEKELYRKNLTDLEIDGYNFKTEPDATKVPGLPSSNEILRGDADAIGSGKMKVKEEEWTSDEISKTKDAYRGKILGTGPLDSSEFREEFRSKYYGDKETLEANKDFDIRSIMSIIINTKEDIKKVETFQKNTIRTIDTAIKELEAIQKDYSKVTDKERNDENESKNRGTVTKVTSAMINMWEDHSNSLTTFFGMVIQWYKDRNRQSKAICVKALGYNKKESYSYSESSVDDLFAGVTIR